MALNLGAHPLAGMGGSQATPRATNSSTWDNVALSTTSTKPPGVCPQGFTCQDIGNGYAPGSQQYNSNGTWTFQAGGPDMWDVFDGFHSVSQSITSDGTVSAEVVSAGPANYDDQWQKSGVMLRQTTDPQSPNYAVLVTPQHGLLVQWRTTQAGTTNQVQVAGPSPEYPVYLMIGRWTDPHPGGATYYTGYWSTDNKTFTAIPGSTVALSMPGTLIAAMVANSYNEKTTFPVVFGNFAIFDGTELIPPGACPTQVSGCADIGGATPPGAQSLTTSGTVTNLTVNAGGGDIWSTADQFHFVWQNLAGDGSVSADVASQANTGPWAKAGVMLRASTDPGAPYYAFFATPSNGLALQWRTTQGAATQQQLVTGTVPVYLKVSRYTDGNGKQWYAAFTSTNGTAWTWVGGSTQQFTIAAPLLAGWAANSYSQTTSTTVVFNNIVTSTASVAPPGGCSATWTCADIGAATPAGSQDLTTTPWTVQGGGGDIWSTSDQFHFVSQPASGDGTISTSITAQQNSNAWAKAGVMMRGSSDPAAPYYAVLVTPGNGVAVQWRATQGGSSSSVAAAGTVPLYLEVSRWTDSSGTTPVTYYSALTSPDGTTWTTVPGSVVSLALPASYLDGLAVTSHNTSVLSSVTATAPVIGTTSTEPPGVCSAAFTCADIGGATPAGTQTQSGAGTWTVQGGGGDIWGTSDQFRFISQALAADGSATAHVVSLGSANAWAKAGVMLRADGSAGAAYYGLFVTPGNGLDLQYRSAAGGTTTQVLASGVTAPIYLRVTRTGTTFTAFTSPDGTTWTAVANSTVTLSGLTGSVLAGLVTCSHDTSNLVTAKFDTVTL